MDELSVAAHHPVQWISDKLIRPGYYRHSGYRSGFNVAGRVKLTPVYKPAVG